MSIDTARWLKLKTLFNEVIDLTPAERDRTLERRCEGDVRLREEIISLLEADDRASGFIERPAAATISDGIAPHPLTIGPWRVIREISRGGMGAVFLCERDDEYKRLVAVKLIRRGMDSDHIIARFRNERRILASLDHPHIARLLDGGTTAEGQPYFVMEFIDGTPIDRYCRERELDLPGRLRLFQSICSAVQYAHRNLIVHRDLKPANILVTGDGVPKLLDFGIAKLLDVSGETDVTATELRILTPDYASPEQIRGERVTTSSDIYSLGVVLYELLTGRKPYRIEKSSPAAIAQAIETTEPLRPSAAVRDDDSPLVARTLGRRLRGDLDNIVLLAMRKDPARRYPSAQALADDIRRHLDGEPVMARPDTWSYRAAKFVRRNRAGVMAASVATLALLGGAAGATWQAVEARQAQERAENRFSQLRKLAHAMIFDIEPEIAEISGSTAAREKLVSNALIYLDSLAGESTDVDLQLELAAAYRRIGQVEGNPYGPNLGKLSDAGKRYLVSRALYERVLREHPRSEAAMEGLAQTLEGLADVRFQQSDLANAKATYTEAIRLREKLATVRPRSVQDERSLALLIVKQADLLGHSGTSNLGQQDLALAEHQRALEMRESLLKANPNHPRLPRDVAESLTKIAYIQNSRGDYEAAAATNQRAIEIAERIAAANPSSSTDQSDYSLACLIAALPLRDMGRYGEAIPLVERSYEVMERVANLDPDSTVWQRNLSVILNHLSAIRTESGRYDAAAEAAERSIILAQRLWRTDTTNLDGALDYAIALRRHVEALMGAGHFGRAERQAQQALTQLEPVIASGNSRAAFERALLEMALAECLSETGRPTEARRYLEHAHEWLQQASQKNPDDVQYADNLARAHLRFGDCQNHRAAAAIYEQLKNERKLPFRSRDEATTAAREAAECGL
jgi:non-specific serine/threonine protein kinase/serine/threonine-protein kinase